MAKTKKTNRGSPEAIAKRRAARALNQLFSASTVEPRLDGRTLKRKRRLTQELREGKGGEPLKALDVLGHATELISLGESLSSLRKLKPKVPPTPPLADASQGLVTEVQSLYGFHPGAWRLLGIDIQKLAEPAKPEAPAKRSKRAAPSKRGAGSKRASSRSR